MNKKVIFVLLLFTTLLAGCWDLTEPQKMYYVQGVGIDFNDDQFEIYAQIIDFTNIARSEQPNPEATQAEIGYAKGKTMEEAIFKLYHSIDQRVFWGHMSYLLFSEEALKSGHVNQIVDSFLRHKDTRYLIWAYSTKESIEDVLLITPIINKAITVSKLSNPLNIYEQESLVEPIDLRKLIIGLNEPSHEIGLPLIKIKENWKTAKEASKNTEFSGVGFISKNGFKGFIESDQIRGMQWMTDETVRGEMTLKVGPGDKNYLTVTLQKISVEVDSVVHNDNVTFDIDVKLEVTVNGLQTAVTTDEIRKGVLNEIEKEIKTTYEAALKQDIDVYRLSEVLYRENVKVWKKLQKDGKIDLTEDSISKLNITISKLSSGRKTFKETVEK